MTRIMYDGITASALPAGAAMVAGYVDGLWPSYAALVVRFPHAVHVPITVDPSGNAGVVGDGPPDNGSWGAWVAWVKRRRDVGVAPTMYTDEAQWATGRQAFADAGVAEPYWWIADYDDDPAIPAGAVAKQYATSDAYDTSSVAAYWPGIDPAPTTAPTTQLEEDNMWILRVAGQSAIYGMSGSRLWHIATEDDVKEYVANGAHQATISQAELANIKAGA